MMVAAVARPAGEAGVSMISSAAGRNAVSRAGFMNSIVTPCFARSNIPMIRSNGMRCPLTAQHRGKASAGTREVFAQTILDNPATVDGDDAVALLHGRKPVRDDDDGAPAHDLAHVVLDHAFAFVVERAGRLVDTGRG
jgi:hypothetical protein